MLFVFIVKWIYYLFILYKNVMDTKILFLLWARLCKDSALIVPQSKETDVDWASTFITSHLWNLGSLWTSFISSVKILLLSFVGQDASYSWTTLWVILSSYKALHSEYSSKHFFWPLFASGESILLYSARILYQSLFNFYPFCCHWSVFPTRLWTLRTSLNFLIFVLSVPDSDDSE